VTQIEFGKECGEDNICEPELAVVWLNVSGVVVGGSQSAGVQVNATLRVHNTGETAYSVTLNVSFPRPSLQFADASPEHSVGLSFMSVVIIIIIIIIIMSLLILATNHTCCSIHKVAVNL